MKLYTLAAIAALAAAAPAAAAIELDVNGLVAAPGPGRAYIESRSALSGTSGYDLGQTFVATKTGGLTRIDLQAFAGGAPTTFTMTVYSGNVTTGTATALGSTTFSGQSLAAYNAGGLTSVSLSGLGIDVTAGSLYSYEISSSHPLTPTPPATTGYLQFAIGTNAGYDPDTGLGIDEVLNGYPGGRSYRETYNAGVSNGWIVDGNFANDRAFATYVDVSPVPEPGEWAMMGAGLLVAGAFARRRKA